MTPTIQDIQAHYDKTIGAFKKANPACSLHGVSFRRRSFHDFIDIDISIYAFIDIDISIYAPLSTHDNFRYCVRSFFKHYLHKKDVIRCWFSVNNQRINIYATSEKPDTIFDEVIFKSETLKLALKVVSDNLQKN